MPDDAQLLAQFIRTRDHSAFALLVERHLPMVYAAARRQVRDDHLAEEVTQKVFILLAQNAPRIRPATILPGWLVNAARYFGLAALRSERRRKHHESQVPPMQPPTSDPAADARTIEPLLSDALASLSARDRTAITLRYLEGKTIPAVGSAMLISTGAAEKRISRALDRLRKFFSRRGRSFTSLTLAAALSSLTVHHAPPALAAAITTAATKTTAAFTLKGALTLMAISKTKSLVVAVVVLLLATTGTLFTIKLIATSSPPPTPNASTATAGPSTIPEVATATPSSLTFPDGTTVELLAIHAEPITDDNWWSADGTPIPTPPSHPAHVSASPARPNFQSFHFLFHAAGKPNAQQGITVRFPGNRPVSIAVVASRSSMSVDASASLPKDASTTDIDVGIAGGEWKTDSTYDVATSKFTLSSLDTPTVTISDNVDQTLVDITPDSHDAPGMQERWAAIAKGKTLLPTQSTSNNDHRSLTFPCPAADITQLLHQTRPFEFQTFKNIALAPRQ